MNRKLLFALSFGLLLAGNALAVADGKWLERVPSQEHEKRNPFQGQAEAVAAGQKLFADHCASCHGGNAEGTRKRPALTSPRVQEQATVGDLHWLLVNGNMRKGMPSWSRLPDQQLWQLVSYVKSLRQ